YLTRTRAWLDALTLEQLNARLNALLLASDQFIYYQAPAAVRLTLPTVARVRQWQAAAKPARVVAPPVAMRQAAPATAQAKAANLPALPVLSAASRPLAAPSNVSAPWPLKRWQLPNGDEVYWLKRPTRDGQLLVRLTSAGGEHSGLAAPLASQAAVQLWAQSGFRFWTAAQNAAFNDGATPAWQWQLKTDHLDGAARIAPAQLPALLSRYTWQVTHGQIAPQVWQAVQGDIRQGLAALAKPSAWQQLTGSVPALPTATDLAPTALHAIATQHLQGATRLYLVGELDAKQLEASLATTLATLPRRASAAALAATPTPSGQHWQVRHQAGLNGAQVRVEWRQPLAWTPERAFLLSSLNPIAQAALKRELRLALSGVYRVSFEARLGQ
ncbi:MAG: hypothetical protein ACRCUZ_10910, partial [Shewanella sp.]